MMPVVVRWVGVVVGRPNCVPAVTGVTVPGRGVAVREIRHHFEQQSPVPRVVLVAFDQGLLRILRDAIGELS